MASDGSVQRPNNEQRSTEYFTGRPLGEIVQALYGVSGETIATALVLQKQSGSKLGDILVDQGHISHEQLAACLSVLVKRETTFLSHAFLSPLKQKWWGRHFQLTLESFLVALLTIALIPRLIGSAESGLIAIFLFSAALTTRFNVVLADIDFKNEAIDILALFTGLLWAFVAVTVTSSPNVLMQSYGLIMDAAGIDPSAMRGPVSIDWLATFKHNSGVLFTVFILSFLYRGYAAVLILSWNACVWGLSLAFMTMHFSQDATGIGTVLIAAKIALAILPHLGLEALAYICVSLSAIKLSKSILWQQNNGPHHSKYLKPCLQGLFAGIALLLLAALVESFVPHQIL
jgi:hypothetical protein